MYAQIKIMAVKQEKSQNLQYLSFQSQYYLEKVSIMVPYLCKSKYFSNPIITVVFNAEIMQRSSIWKRREQAKAQPAAVPQKTRVVQHALLMVGKVSIDQMIIIPQVSSLRQRISIECVTTITPMTYLHSPIQWHTKSIPRSHIIPRNMLLHVLCWNLTRKMHRVISASAVGTLINILRLQVLVYVSNDICATFILKQMANMNKNPNNSFKFTDRLNTKEVIPSGFRLTNLCQWLLDRSIKMGCFPFSLAMLLRILKAPNLSKGQVKTADQFSLLTRTESTKAGRAHKTLKLILLSSLDMMEEERLNTKGPTKRHARRSRHVLFLDFSIFCQKNRTNWMTSDGMQCIEAITQPKTLKYVASVIEQVTTPKVNILHEILIAVFLPLISAKLPYIIKPTKDNVQGSYFQHNSHPVVLAEQTEIISQGALWSNMINNIVGIFLAYDVVAGIISFVAALHGPGFQGEAVDRFFEQEELDGNEE